MSKEAPWIALAIDWQDSEMLDGTSHGIRLAWVCLLCFAKAQGRAGKVRLRDNGFARKYDLNVEAVRSMLERAEHAGAVIVDGDVVTVVNWRRYQDPRVRSTGDDTKHRENKADPKDNQHFTKTAENNATKERSPPTNHHPPPTKKTRVFVKPTLAEVAAYCEERGGKVNAQKWFDHYESNGWRVGKNPMKDWKAAVRKWEDSEYGRPTNATRYSSARYRPTSGTV
jgi:hypothetical protein